MRRIRASNSQIKRARYVRLRRLQKEVVALDWIAYQRFVRARMRAGNYKISSNRFDKNNKGDIPRTYVRVKGNSVKVWETSEPQVHHR